MTAPFAAEAAAALQLSLKALLGQVDAQIAAVDAVTAALPVVVATACRSREDAAAAATRDGDQLIRDLKYVAKHLGYVADRIEFAALDPARRLADLLAEPPR